MDDTNSTVETTDRPATMADAFSQVSTASSADTPETDATPAVSADAAPTQPPAETTPAQDPAEASEKPAGGEPPKWRWQDILANARETAAAEAKAAARQELEQQYSGLQDFASLSADERRGLVIWNRAMQGDPSALAQVERVNPSLAAAISGKTAQTQTAEPDAEPQPDAAIRLEDGSTVPVFTPEGMKKWQQWNHAHLKSTLTQEFQPLMSLAEQQRQHEAQQRAAEETTRWAASVFAPLQRMPHFAEFKPELQKAIASMPPTVTNLEEYVYDAYANLLQAKTSSLTKAGETQALATMQQRAVAGTSNPAAAATATPRRPRSMSEAMQQVGG